MATKTTRKQVKPPVNRKIKVASASVINLNREPDEEEIRELAEILYHQRIETGEYGTAEEDWLKAEEYLSYSKE